MCFKNRKEFKLKNDDADPEISKLNKIAKCYSEGLQKLEQDISIVNIIKMLKKHESAINCQTLFTNFRNNSVKHAYENLIDLDSDDSNKDKAILAQDEDEIDLNIMKCVIPRQNVVI